VIKKNERWLFLSSSIMLSLIFVTMYSSILVNAADSNGGDFPYVIVLTLLGVLLMGIAVVILLRRRR